MANQMTDEQAKAFVNVATSFLINNQLGPDAAPGSEETEGVWKAFLIGFFRGIASEIESTGEQPVDLSAVPPDAEMMLSLNMPVSVLMETTALLQNQDSKASQFWTEVSSQVMKAIERTPEAQKFLKSRGS